MGHSLSVHYLYYPSVFDHNDQGVSQNGGGSIELIRDTPRKTTHTDSLFSLFFNEIKNGELWEPQFFIFQIKKTTKSRRKKKYFSII